MFKKNRSTTFLLSCKYLARNASAWITVFTVGISVFWALDWVQRPCYLQIAFLNPLSSSPEMCVSCGLPIFHGSHEPMSFDVLRWAVPQYESHPVVPFSIHLSLKPLLILRWNVLWYWSLRLTATVIRFWPDCTLEMNVSEVALWSIKNWSLQHRPILLCRYVLVTQLHWRCATSSAILIKWNSFLVVYRFFVVIGKHFPWTRQHSWRDIGRMFSFIFPYSRIRIWKSWSIGNP